MIIINLDKAKEIKKDLLRVEREPLLEALDVEYMKALEINDTIRMGEIVVEKQRLRDITLLVDAADSLDELERIVL